MRINDSGNTVKLSDKRLHSLLDTWSKDKQEFHSDEFDELVAEVAITNEF